MGNQIVQDSLRTSSFANGVKHLSQINKSDIQLLLLPLTFFQVLSVGIYLRKQQ